MMSGGRLAEAPSAFELFRYSVGVHFMYFLNTERKYSFDVKPLSNAISLTVLFVESSSPQAYRSLIIVT